MMKYPHHIYLLWLSVLLIELKIGKTFPGHADKTKSVLLNHLLPGHEVLTNTSTSQDSRTVLSPRTRTIKTNESFVIFPNRSRFWDRIHDAETHKLSVKIMNNYRNNRIHQKTRRKRSAGWRERDRGIRSPKWRKWASPYDGNPDGSHVGKDSIETYLKRGYMVRVYTSDTFDVVFRDGLPPSLQQMLGNPGISRRREAKHKRRNRRDVEQSSAEVHDSHHRNRHQIGKAVNAEDLNDVLKAAQVVGRNNVAGYQCDGNPCKNGGSCFVPKGSMNKVCSCPPGFYGVHCEGRQSYCLSLPCLNGGTCVGYDNGFECLCRPGFFGQFCEMDANDCASQPCLNGGKCFDLVSGYRCVCGPKFEGENCERPRENKWFQMCEVNVCVNSGICLRIGEESIKCICSEPYTGERCQLSGQRHFNKSPGQQRVVQSTSTLSTVQSTSTLSTVQSSSTLRTVQSSSTRQVVQSPSPYQVFLWAGQLRINRLTSPSPRVVQSSSSPRVVQSPITLPVVQSSVCSQNSCNNGGICKAQANGEFTCQCPAAFMGKQCELRSNPCNGSPCPEDSVCVEDTTDFSKGYNCEPSKAETEVITYYSRDYDDFQIFGILLASLILIMAFFYLCCILVFCFDYNNGQGRSGSRLKIMRRSKWQRKSEWAAAAASSLVAVNVCHQWHTVEQERSRTPDNVCSCYDGLSDSSKLGQTF